MRFSTRLYLTCALAVGCWIAASLMQTPAVAAADVVAAVADVAAAAAVDPRWVTSAVAAGALRWVGGGSRPAARPQTSHMQRPSMGHASGGDRATQRSLAALGRKL